MTAPRAVTVAANQPDPNSSTACYGEHDFGALTVAGVRLLWKIDYYDAGMGGGSPDPADPSVTTRVLTLMLVDEW